ncbi:MAG: hypothetical protein ACI8QZ_002983 [Chlamydiales bacterium]|jgi:hypothetical protein
MFQFLVPILGLILIAACSSRGVDADARDTLTIHVAGFVKAEGMT